MLHIELLKKEDIKLFDEEQAKSFDIHKCYFENGKIPGPSEDEKDDYNLNIIIDKDEYTILAIFDDDKFISGAIVKSLEKGIYEIEIFFLTVDSLGKGLGKSCLDLVEGYFKDARLFRLVTPSQVLRNTIFYVNHCNYHIVKCFDYDRRKNTCDFLFEKEI